MLCVRNTLTLVGLFCLCTAGNSHQIYERRYISFPKKEINAPDCQRWQRSVMKNSLLFSHDPIIERKITELQDVGSSCAHVTACSGHTCVPYLSYTEGSRNCSSYLCHSVNSKVTPKESRMDESADDLVGKTITVGITSMPPTTITEIDNDGNLRSVNGHLVAIWNIIEEELGFQTKWILPRTGTFGGPTENGTFDGVIGELEAGRADVGLVAFGMTQSRLKVVNFSTAIDYDTSQLLIHSDYNWVPIDWNMYLRALSWEAWFCLIGTWLVFSVVLTFASRSEDAFRKVDMFLTLMGALVTQGSEVSPGTFRTRILFVSFWMMCLVVFFSFTAGLTTQLAVVQEHVYQNLGEILDDGYKVMVVARSFHDTSILQDTTDNDFERVRKGFEENPHLRIPLAEMAVPSIIDTKYAFLFDTTLLRSYTSNNCSFKILRPRIFSNYLHLAYDKNFPYQDIIDRKLVEIASVGIRSRIFGKDQATDYWTRCVQQGDGTVPIGLDRTFLAFLFIIAGVFLSAIIYLLEIYHSRQINKTATKEN